MTNAFLPKGHTRWAEVLRLLPIAVDVSAPQRLDGKARLCFGNIVLLDVRGVDTPRWVKGRWPVWIFFLNCETDDFGEYWIKCNMMGLGQLFQLIIIMTG